VTTFALRADLVQRAHKSNLHGYKSLRQRVARAFRLYDVQGDEDEEAEKMPSVAERIKQMESKKIRFSAMRDKAAKRR